MDNTTNQQRKTGATRGQFKSMLTDLNFAQINLLHCKKATYIHCRDIRVEHTDLSLIQEPWIRGNRIHGFGQIHDRLFYCKNGKRPRAAIYVAPRVMLCC